MKRSYKGTGITTKDKRFKAMIEPGTYTIPVEILPNGNMKFNFNAIKPVAKAPKSPKSFKDSWEENAPFTFEFFVNELMRQGVITKNKEWRRETRGGKKTCSFEIVGCYECLLDLGCLPLLSWPNVARLFNEEFAAGIRNSKVLENKKKTHHQCEYFQRVFSCSRL